MDIQLRRAVLRENRWNAGECTASFGHDGNGDGATDTTLTFLHAQGSQCLWNSAIGVCHYVARVVTLANDYRRDKIGGAAMSQVLHELGGPQVSRSIAGGC